MQSMAADLNGRPSCMDDRPFLYLEVGFGSRRAGREGRLDCVLVISITSFGEPMSRPEKDEYAQYVARRVGELLRGKIASLPGASCKCSEQDPIYGPATEAINRAYVQGWVDAELDFVETLGLHTAMRDDPGTHGELWDIAQRKPATDDALLYRRDWIEYEYARDQLQLVGIDPSGERPATATTALRDAATAKK